MVTAARSAPRNRRGPSDADAKAAAMTFDAYEENSGRHRWELLTPDGVRLATSCASYSSHADAERAARKLHDGTRAKGG
jgi:hypothetical protein